MVSRDFCVKVLDIATDWLVGSLRNFRLRTNESKGMCGDTSPHKKKKKKKKNGQPLQNQIPYDFS